jgi:hypothetical protein
MLQQKIHRERLEEIARQKEEEKHTSNVVYYENTPLCDNNLDLLIQNQQNELSKLLLLNMNPKLSANLSNPTNCIQNFHPSKHIFHKKDDAHNQTNENEVNLENLASLVYEKLMIKKNEKKTKSLVSNDISNISVKSVKQHNENFLAELICEEKSQETNKYNNKKNIKTQVKQFPSTSIARLDPKYYTNTNAEQEIKESKLIEELFFI